MARLTRLLLLLSEELLLLLEELLLLELLELLEELMVELSEEVLRLRDFLPLLDFPLCSLSRTPATTRLSIANFFISRSSLLLLLLPLLLAD
jgi:hypothetical protein